MPECGDANSRFLGLVSGGGGAIVRSLDQNGIETVQSSKQSVDDVKHIA